MLLMRSNINDTFTNVNDPFIFFSGAEPNNPLMNDFSKRVSAYLESAGLRVSDLYLFMDNQEGAKQKANNWRVRGNIPLAHRDWVLGKMGVFDGWKDWFRDGVGDAPPTSIVQATLGPLRNAARRGVRRRPPPQVVKIPQKAAAWPFTDELLVCLAKNPDKALEYEVMMRAGLKLPPLSTEANEASTA